MEHKSITADNTSSEQNRYGLVSVIFFQIIFLVLSYGRHYIFRSYF